MLEPVDSAPASAAAYLEAQAYALGDATAKCVSAAMRAGELAAGIGWTSLAKRAFVLGLEEAYGAYLWGGARECALGLLAVQESGEDARAVAYTQEDIARIDYRRGDLSGSLRHLDESLAIYVALDALADAAKARSFRCVVLAQSGLLRRAQEDVRELLANERLLVEPEAVAELRSRVAIVYTKLGNLGQALDVLESEAAGAKKAGDHGAHAIALGNMGHVHRGESEWKAAIDRFREALRLFAREEDGIQVAFARLSIAEVLAAQARAGMQDADIAALLADLGRGQPPESESQKRQDALRQCEEGLALLKEARSFFDTSGCLIEATAARVARAELLLCLGRWQGLKAELERARDEGLRLQAPEIVSSALAALVGLQVDQEEWPAAIESAREAAEHLSKGYGCLSDADIVRARSFGADVYDLGIRAAGEAGRLRDLHYFLEKSRAAALLRGMGGRAAALRATVPQDLQERLRAAVAAKVGAMAGRDQKLRRGRGADRAALNKTVEKARRSELDLRTEIQVLEQKAAEHLLPPRVEVMADLKRSLKRSGEGRVPTTYLAFNLQARDGWCLIVDSKGERLVHLEPKDVLPVHKALEAVVEGRHGEWAPDTLEDLRAHLLGPLNLPKGEAHYLISPDRELAYVPYAALLPDDVTFSLVPSATTYLMLREQSRKRGKGVFGIGDPRYSTAQDEKVFASRGGTPLVRLKNSAKEIVSATGGKDDLRLLGADATKARFLAGLQSKGPGWRWHAVHIACHGFVDVEWPSLSALALAPTETDDGFLLADELLRLPLKCDLMVLSACETGRGRYVRAEGIMGLARSCMYAGAPRILCSLWLVDDDASGFLMQKFHQAWGQGMTTAGALRAAQIAVRDHVVEQRLPGGKVVPTTQWSDPSYWAGWALWGLPE